MRSPGKQQYYDPFIEEAPQEVQLQLRGIAVGEPGTYILIDDFIEAIRTYAFAASSSKEQQAIYGVISWLEETFIGESEDVGSVKADRQFQEATFGKFIKTTLEDAERIELYPDADRKWHARVINKDGLIIGEVNDGSFDQKWVEEDAAEQYPDLEIVQLESENEDSTWTHKGPSKRLWNR